MTVASRGPRSILSQVLAGPVLGILLCNPVYAQKIHNTYGSPLDTIENTHLTTEVPPAQAFVRATSPDKKTLDYTPLTGVEPERPKPRDAAGVKALEAELETAGARNAQRAQALGARKPVTARPRKAPDVTAKR